MTADFSKLKHRLKALELRANTAGGFPGLTEKDGKVKVVWYIKILNFFKGKASDPETYFTRLEKEYLHTDREKGGWPIATEGAWEAWQELFTSGHFWVEPLDCNASECQCTLCVEEREEQDGNVSKVS